MTLMPNPKSLLVEGKQDEYVVKSLLSRHVPPLTFDIKPKGGFEELRKSIPSEVKISGRSVLGILADSNDNIAGRWQSITDQLKKSGCEVPDAICQSGSVFPGPRNIRVGVWLMPDNKQSGELENFIFSMIPRNDPILPRAMCYVDNIPECERKFENHKLTRAYVHSWLATCKKPRPMGTAIKAGYLSHDVEIVDSFVKWLRRLFSQ